VFDRDGVPIHRTLIVCAIAIVGCVHPSRDRAWLGASVLERTHQRLGPSAPDPAAPLPVDCQLDDGLSPDEAVGVAFWRSPSLQAELTRLDAAMADLDEASRLPNPRLSFLAPIDPRQLALILAWPIDAIWQRPERAEAATRELEAVAESLVQVALDLERSVRIAYVEVWVTQSRCDVLDEVAATWRAAAALTRDRVNAGDLSDAEASAAVAEALIAEDAVARARGDQLIAQARLLALLGAPWPTVPRLAKPAASPRNEPIALEHVDIALNRRADVRAARLALHAAAARASWERSRAFALVATLDGQAPRGELAPRFSLGAQLDIPIFSLNQGGIGRAEAGLVRASHAYAALRLSATAEVIAAIAAYGRAQTSSAAYHSAVDAFSRVSASARNAFQNGDQSYLFVVEATRREAEAKLRLVELDAEIVRTEAELARATGGFSAEDSR
jgi:outer membrane protein, heavy metal efflux system